MMPKNSKAIIRSSHCSEMGVTILKLRPKPLVMQRWKTEPQHQHAAIAQLQPTELSF